MGRPANRADILVASEIRQRRPIIREGPAIDETESDVEVKRTENQVEKNALAQRSVRRRLDDLRRALTVRLLKPHRIATSLMARPAERSCVTGVDRHHLHRRLHDPRPSFLRLHPAWSQLQRKRS